MTEEQAATANQDMTAGQFIGGCLTIIVIGVVILAFIASGLKNSDDLERVAETQSLAMTLQVLQETDGAESLADLVRDQPQADRREHARQIVDYWFNTNKPALYPTEGVDADWLQNDADRKRVKQQMLETIMEWVEKDQ